MIEHTTHHLHPPFPTDIPTAPLVSVSLTKLQAGDLSESDAFFDAAQNLGFFYLDMLGSQLGERMVKEAEQLKSLNEQFFQLDLDEKKQYAVNVIDPFFGYKRKEFAIPGGGVQIGESYNVKKDDLLAVGEPLPHPPLIDDKWSLLTQYTRDCREVIDILLTILDRQLHLQPGTLGGLHRLDKPAGDHIRFNRHEPAPYDEATARSREHTDFGTLTVLFNWMGGLQIRMPEKDDSPGIEGEWVWVKPLPGKAIINLGDALVRFTAGILRSNVHRVVAPPSPQDGVTRSSLVFFSRPENDVPLKRLKGGLIDARPSNGEEDEMGIRSDEWVRRRGTAAGDMSGVYTHKGGLEKRDAYGWMKK